MLAPSSVLLSRFFFEPHGTCALALDDFARATALQARLLSMFAIPRRHNLPTHLNL